ncbi:MAG: hypothetical protein FJ134_04475 [Deltaproteobacteria bacterium]|nr:hypothetical protein [Deltaproteobacteria bacterium]
MERREFLRRLGVALAAGWAWGRAAWPVSALAEAPEIRLAFLADSHLKNGDARQPEARALARAVGEIRNLQPRPDLVLFAGDLAHNGNPPALALGREIISDLPAPVLMVRGEGDGSPESSHWPRLFGNSWFLRTHKGVNFLGLYTHPCRSPHGPAFALGENQIAWLGRELARLDPAAPLIVVSHAPLTPIFHPWGQWTRDGERLAPLLVRFRHAVYLHGHIHQTGVRFQVSGFRFRGEGIGSLNLLTENRKQKTENSISLPATAWPLPSPLQGTPKALSPGLGPQGCGWAMISLHSQSWQFQPQVWTA